MATHDYILANASGAAFRTDLNNALAAIVSNNSNSSSPATTYAYQWWADTSNAVLKIRNSANDAWIELLQLDGTLTLEDGSASTPALAFRDDLNTGIYSSAADTFNVATGGVERMELGTTTIFNKDGENVDFKIEGDTDQELFYLDAGANRVGISIDVPTAKFHVASGSDTEVGVRVSGGASGGTDIADFRTNNGTIRMKINNDVEVVTGNLKIGTSGKGISFSETGDGAGSQSSELLADYEEGTFTPTLPNGGGTVTFTTFCAKYIKVGNVVHIFCDIGSIANHQNLDLRIGGFPYTSSSTNATTATLLTGRADPGDGLTVNVFDSSAFCDVRSQFNSDGQKGQLFNGHGVHFNLTYLTN